MEYKKYLEKLRGCPFCEIKKSEIILENDEAVLTLAKAPYVESHLLVFPKKHRLKLSSMNKKEQEKVLDLVKKGMEKIKKIEKNSITILYREGNKKSSGKSISHLHIHLIPRMRIGTKDINSDEREIYSNEDYLKKIKKLRRKFDGKKN
jgi:diadenosine tetraphosphate (Ap4A) HIT family hydrolase